MIIIFRNSVHDSIMKKYKIIVQLLLVVYEGFHRVIEDVSDFLFRFKRLKILLFMY